MNFESLLDEDGQGSRELDAWIAENISEISYISSVEPAKIPQYTTGDSIDPIWELANSNGFIAIEPAVGGWRASCNIIDGDVIEDKNISLGKSEPHHDEKVAIAEALFKAYQEREDGE